jgi:hypothetical protein
MDERSDNKQLNEENNWLDGCLGCSVFGCFPFILLVIFLLTIIF